MDVAQQLVLVRVPGIRRKRAPGVGLGSLWLTQLNQVPRQICEHVRPIRLHLEDALLNRGHRLQRTLPRQLGRHRLVLGDGVVVHPLLLQQLGYLQATGGVRGIEGGHLAQQLEGFPLLALLVVAVSRSLQRVDRLGIEPHSLIQVGERDLRAVALGIEVQDLLVDGDGSSVEAIRLVLIGDPRVL